MSAELTTQEKQKVQDFLSRKGAQAQCNLCGGKNFSVQSHLFFPNVIDTSWEAEMGGPNMYTFAGVACDNCGKVDFVSTKHMGLMLGSAEHAL